MGARINYRNAAVIRPVDLLRIITVENAMGASVAGSVFLPVRVTGL